LSDLQAAVRTELEKTGLLHATDLIRRICRVSEQQNFVEEIRTSFQEAGLLQAVQRHDNDVIFTWLAEAISYQGISDTVAARFIEEHGTVEASDIDGGLDEPNGCPKLTSYWQFERCGYRKTLRTCNQSRLLRRCPLPKHDLRNGGLNIAAYSLFLFLRDVTGGDFVAWLDKRLAQADRPGAQDRSERLIDAVVNPLLHVHGLSHKVLHMTLASLLLAGDPARERWRAAGEGMIAIDTLVHNFLWRSGVLARLDANHPYGPRCYRAGGCADIIRAVSRKIDAREFNPSFPRSFPRFVQRAVWKFGAGTGLNQCNGNRIRDDRKPCPLRDCVLFIQCDRIALTA